MQNTNNYFIPYNCIVIKNSQTKNIKTMDGKNSWKVMLLSTSLIFAAVLLANVATPHVNKMLEKKS